jgi:hypothetical protein
VAVAEAGGGFGSVSQLATDGGSGDVAVRPDGAVLVAWSSAINAPGPDSRSALRTG